MKIDVMGLAIAFGLLAAGCAPVPVVNSHKEPGYAGQPKRIFILSHLQKEGIGARLPAPITSAFMERFSDDLRGCGVEVAAWELTGMELDDKPLKEAAVRSRAELVVVFKKVHGFVSKTGLPILNVEVRGWASSDPAVSAPAAMLANRSASLVWLAMFTFHVADAKADREAEALAVEVVNKMKTDGIFPGCAPAAVPRRRSSTDEG